MVWTLLAKVVGRERVAALKPGLAIGRVLLVGRIALHRDQSASGVVRRGRDQIKPRPSRKKVVNFS